MVQAVCEEKSEFHVNRIKVEWPPLAVPLNKILVVGPWILTNGILVL